MGRNWSGGLWLNLEDEKKIGDDFRFVSVLKEIFQL